MDEDLIANGDKVLDSHEYYVYYAEVTEVYEDGNSIGNEFEIFIAFIFYRNYAN